MTETLRAFHGKASVKKKYVNRVNAHRRADEIVQGVGWESNGKTRGCAVGCIFNRYDHDLAPVEIGFPAQLAHLADVIHESLPLDLSVPKDKRRKSWVQRFIDAPRPGADMSLVWPRFAVWLLVDPSDGVIRFFDADAAVEKSICDVAALWQRVIDGESAESLQNEFSAASAAAWAAARDAASAAAWAAAWEAAWAASSAAAWAAAWEAAWAAARAAAWEKYADKLIELMKAA